ncbi:MAG: hypothetical protein IPG97_02165 [Microthrixaceae bacterium]|jgi:hypothetical protein|nr:hypothetical protein [Microthrixaceae bacterium]
MLEDGTYDAVVVDAEEGPAPHSTRVELAIAAGPHKGELVAIVTDLTLIASRDPLDLLALPATITVEAGIPSLTIEG